MYVHIDGDILKYRAGFAAEKMHYYVAPKQPGVDPANLKYVHFPYKKEVNEWLEANSLTEKEVIIDQRREAEPVANALSNVKSLIKNIVEELQADDNSYTVYLSGPTNFRDDVATILPYKGHRVAPKPIHGPAIVDYILKHYTSNVSEYEEADDVVSYSHYSMWKDDPYSSCIVTVDKDLDMVPGLHYNFVRDEHYDIAPDVANRNFWIQVLTGDSTDNIPGIRGVGPKTAEKYLVDVKDNEHFYELCLSAYRAHAIRNPEERIAETGQLLWMRREPGEVWTPELMMETYK